MPIDPPTAPTPPNAPVAPTRSGITPIATTTPVAEQRTKAPDLTGLYEHIPTNADGSTPTTKNSAVLLQINQAGRAIVGWFSRPPSFVSDLAQTVSRAGN
ncbi:MAG: hypothetical protein ABI035_06435, partial [Gemmatimonadaceae bacterium]